VRAEGEAAAERAYRAALDQTPHDAAAARKAASEASKRAIKLAASREADLAAKAKAEACIASGEVFDLTKLAPDAKLQLAAFQAGARGASAQRLSPQLEGQPVAEQVRLLDAEVAAGHATRTTEPLTDPTTPGAMQDQRVYAFADGALIRIKPKGDKFSPGEAMFSVEVKKAPPSDALPAQQGVAFKVDARGRAIPKGPFEVKNPYHPGTQAQQHRAFEQAVMDAGHRKAAP
jgi:hypothetical protein